MCVVRTSYYCGNLRICDEAGKKNPRTQHDFHAKKTSRVFLFFRSVVGCNTDPNGGVPATGSNRTDAGLALGDRSLTLESGVDIDESLVSRSPLVRTLAPVFRFFRSRAGEEAGRRSGPSVACVVFGCRLLLVVLVVAGRILRWC